MKEITDIFLASAGYEGIIKISVMAYPKQLRNLTFSEISEIIKINLRLKKKLVIEERNNSLSIKQKQDESVIQYLHRLTEAIKNW